MAKVSVMIVSGAALMIAMTAFGQTRATDKPDAVMASVSKKHLKPQKTCPILGEPIDKPLFVDYKGKRIYVCCKDCINQVKKDPEAAIKKLESIGEEPEVIFAAKAAKAGHKKAVAEDASMKSMNMSGPDKKETDMPGMNMGGDSSMGSMDHSKMK